MARHGSSVPALLRFLERDGRIVEVDTDRYYVVSTNLLGEWGLKPRLIYYHTIYSEGDIGDTLLTTDRYDVKGGYAEFKLDGHIPLIKGGTEGTTDYKTGVVTGYKVLEDACTVTLEDRDGGLDVAIDECREVA